MSNPQFPPNQGPGYGQPIPPNQPDGYGPGPGGPYPPQGTYPPPGGYPPPNGFPPAPGGYQNQPPPGYPQNYNAPPPPYGYPQQPAYGYGVNTGIGAAAVKADFSKRFVSYLIDGIIMGVLFFIVFIVFTILGAGVASSDIGTYNSKTGYYEGGNLGAGFGLIAIGYLIGLFVPFVYLVLLISKGQTLGNKVAGMKIVKADGSQPGFGAALVRTLVQFFLSGWFIIGYLWMLWDPEQQTLHDKIAKTYGVVA